MYDPRAGAFDESDERAEHAAKRRTDLRSAAANRALKTASSGKRGSKSRKVEKATTNVPGHHVRRFLAPDPTVRHRSATQGDLLIATRSNQPMPEYRRPTISGSGPPKLKRARRSLNRRSQRPSSRRRKPNGNAHSKGAQSLASRFWATQIVALQLARNKGFAA